MCRALSWGVPLPIDLTGLDEALASKGYDLQSLCLAHPFAVFGSRGAGCHRANSDWDVVALTAPQLALRGGGLDYLQEDPPNDPRWYSRDLAFHLTGYAVWLSGGPNWDPALLDWDRAVARKTKKIRETASIIGRGLLSPGREAKWVTHVREELGRMIQLRDRIPISPTALLPSVTVEDFRQFQVDADFLRLIATPHSS